MPRKQRFKPSRKPKVVDPPQETPVIEREDSASRVERPDGDPPRPPAAAIAAVISPTHDAAGET